MQVRQFTALVGEFHIQILSHGFSQTLQGEEGFLIAPNTGAEHALFLGVLGQRQSLGNENAAHFKQTAFHVASLLVAGDGMDHGSSQSGSHDGQTFIDGVHQRNGHALGSIFSIAQQIQISGREEGVVDTFMSTGSTQGAFQAKLSFLLRIQTTGGNLSGGHEGGDYMIVTVHTDDFLSNIRIVFHILTEGGNLQSQLIAIYNRIHIQAGQNTNDIFGGNFDTQYSVYFIDADFHFTRFYGIAGVHITVSTGNFTTAQLFDQMQGTLQSHNGGILIHALCITGTGIGHLTMSTGALTDIIAGELSALEHHLGGGVQNLRIQTTHDTGQGYGFYTVADHQVGVIQSEFFAVQSHDLLAVMSAAYIDRIAFQIVIIEGVHGLTHFLQYIVGNINNVGDGIDTHQSQTAFHPSGRFTDLYIIYIVSHVARTQIGSIYGNGETFFSNSSFGVIQSGSLQLFTKSSSHFTGNTENALAVCTVCIDGDVEHPIVQTQQRLNISTDLSIFRQNQQTIVTGTGIQILCQTQFNTGAQHTMGLIAAQFTFFDLHNTFDSLMIFSSCVYRSAYQSHGEFAAGTNIIGTTADLQAFTLTYIYFTNMQVSFRNGFAFFHQTNNNTANIFTDLPGFFYFETTVEQSFFQYFRLYINIDIFSQPTQGN